MSVHLAVHAAAQVFPLLPEAELGELAADIKANGLRHPIVLYKGEILDGRNRYRACELAEVKPSFTTYDGDDPVAYVVSANLKRRHLDESQRSMVGARMVPLLHEEALKRQGTRTDLSANLREGLEDAGKAAEYAAREVFVSPRSVESAIAVIKHAIPEVVSAVDRGVLAVSAAAEIAKLDKPAQRDIAKRVRIDAPPPGKPGEKGKRVRTGQIKAFVRQEQRAKVAERLAVEAPKMPTGPFRVIVADPPWPYEKRAGDATHRGDLPYPPMAIEAICGLDVGKLAHPDGAVLWLWTTNAFMRDAYRVLDAWGFAEKTILTWVKDRIGLGDWLRGQTEHCILAVRGRPTVILTTQTTVLNGPVREHSRKPDTFYTLVESLCPGSKVEMFARTPRPGWAKWGAETERFHAPG